MRHSFTNACGKMRILVTAPSPARCEIHFEEELGIRGMTHEDLRDLRYLIDIALDIPAR